jgi:hypothetical protein
VGEFPIGFLRSDLLIQETIALATAGFRLDFHSSFLIFDCLGMGRL